ncbi:hypothetical protein KM043_016572 [Ampulex compressa]|nr:hypothetical protein KM043_016572 [Ampulex compressa]
MAAVEDTFPIPEVIRDPGCRLLSRRHREIKRKRVLWNRGPTEFRSMDGQTRPFDFLRKDQPKRVFAIKRSGRHGMHDFARLNQRPGGYPIDKLIWNFARSAADHPAWPYFYASPIPLPPYVPASRF